MTALLDNEIRQRTERDKKDRDLWLLILALLDDDEPLKVWAEYAPATFTGLLDGNGFVWDAQRQFYKSDSGTTINANAVQRIVIAASHAQEIEIERKFKASAGGDLDKWRDSSMDDLAAMYLAVAAVGVGGIDNLDEDAIAGVVTATAAARDSLENIVAELQAGRISEAQAMNRAGMSAQQMNGVLQDARRVSHMNAADENGVAIYTKERNVLTKTAQHCSECPDLTAQGWVAIGTLPLPGQRECMSNCKCHIEFGTEDSV